MGQFDMQIKKIEEVMLGNNNLFMKTREQLYKDLNLCGISQLNEDESVKGLVNGLIDLVTLLFEKDPEQLRNLLYRIDISENILVEAIQNESQGNQLFIKISQEILLKELTKVQNRASFS